MPVPPCFKFFLQKCTKTNLKSNFRVEVCQIYTVRNSFTCGTLCENDNECSVPFLLGSFFTVEEGFSVYWTYPRNFQKPYEFALRVHLFANPKPVLNCLRIFCPECLDRIIAPLVYLLYFKKGKKGIFFFTLKCQEVVQITPRRYQT